MQIVVEEGFCQLREPDLMGDFYCGDKYKDGVAIDEQTDRLHHPQYIVLIHPFEQPPENIVQLPSSCRGAVKSPSAIRLNRKEWSVHLVRVSYT